MSHRLKGYLPIQGELIRELITFEENGSNTQYMLLYGHELMMGFNESNGSAIYLTIEDSESGESILHIGSDELDTLFDIPTKSVFSIADIQSAAKDVLIENEKSGRYYSTISFELEKEHISFEPSYFDGSILDVKYKGSQIYEFEADEDTSIPLQLSILEYEDDGYTDSSLHFGDDMYLCSLFQTDKLTDITEIKEWAKDTLVDYYNYK